MGVFGPQRRGVLVPEPRSETKDRPPQPPIRFDPSRLPQPPWTPGPFDPSDPGPEPPSKPPASLDSPATNPLEPPPDPGTLPNPPARPARPRVHRQRRYLRRGCPSGPPQRRAGSGTRTRRAPRQPAAPTATTTLPPAPPPPQPGGGAGPGPAAGEARHSRPPESAGTWACADSSGRKDRSGRTPESTKLGGRPHRLRPHRNRSAPTPKQREVLKRPGDGPCWERSRENRASISQPPSRR